MKGSTEREIPLIVYYITILCGVGGFLLLLVGLYGLVFSLDAYRVGQILVVSIPDMILGTRTVLALSIVLIVLWSLNLYLGYILYLADPKAVPLFLMLFGFQSIISIPLIIGPVAYGFPIINLVLSERYRLYASRTSNTAKKLAI